MKPKFMFLKEIIEKDKRKCERLILPLQVFYALQPSGQNPSPQWQGPFALDNISGNGLSFIVNQFLVEGTTLNLQVHYSSQEEPIIMIGKIMRCQLEQPDPSSGPGEDSLGYILGLHIYKTKKGDRKKFINFISDNILDKYMK